MWSRGTISGDAVLRVLVQVSAQSSTGTLTVQGAEDVLAVRFRQGEVVGADALKESFERGFGAVLVEEELISPRQVVEVAEADVQGTVYDHLLNTGLVASDDLYRCLREHSYRLLLRLLVWSSGEFQFYEGEVSWNRSVQPLSVEEILVRASPKIESLVGGRIGPLTDEVLRPVLQGRAPRVLSWDESSSVNVGEGEWLTPLEDALLRSLDGLTPALDFKDTLGIDEFRLRFALHRLRSAGLVERVDDLAHGLDTETSAPDQAEAAAEGVDPGSSGSGSAKFSQRLARVKELSSLLSDLSRGFSYILAAGLAVLLLVMVLWGGSSSYLHHPFPWQESSRQSLDNLRATASYRDISGKLQTYHVLFGTFPLDFDPLMETGLVSERTLRDARGREIAFESLEQGYVLELRVLGEATGTNRLRFDAKGDFLLDPERTRVEDENEQPLFVID